MQLQVSARVVARLVSRLASPALPLVSQAAAPYERKVQRLIVRSARTVRTRIDMRALEDSLIFGGTGAPIYVMEPELKDWERELLGDGVEPAPTDWLKMRAAKDKEDIPTLMKRALTSGGRAAGIKLDMAFDELNPLVVEWAEQHAAELVTEITTEARAAIRAIVTEGFQVGMAPRETAKLIRATVGLTERDALAVMRRHITMLADGVDAALATKRAERYADKLLRSRAQTIARTETMRAANEGQQQLWQQARDKGLLDVGTAKKVWIATYDACPRCQSLDGEEVPLTADFSEGVDPPLHPNCRCTMGIA